VAILYPNEIINVFIQGTEFTGNMVSVGNDGYYSYDYSHPRTAAVNEPDDTLILIYPGSYTINNNTYDVSNKDFMWRGMGDSVTDVYLNQSFSYPALEISGNYNKIILENFRIRTGGSGADPIEFRNGTILTDVYLNKLYIDHSSGVSNTAPVDFYSYQGNAYLTYSYVTTTRPSQYRGIGRYDSAAVYSFLALEYNKAYDCLSCDADPDPHGFSVGPAINIGYNYGDYLIQFNVPPPQPPPSALPQEPLYQNVWVVGDNIYHTTSSGIDVYNSNASILTDHLPLPEPATSVWANDEYIYMGTLGSGVYRSTTSGAAYPYIKEPDTTSNYIIYLHGADDFLCLSTIAGVDRYDLSTASGTTISGADRIYTYDEDIHKCFQTTSGTLYYSENNTFFNVDESPTGLGRPLREWTYYQLINFLTTTIDNSQVEVIFQNDFPYYNVKDAGADLRFIDDYGNNLSYYIKSWYPTATVLVKVPAAGSNRFYMLYGNDFATAQSNIANTYWFYDNFSTLDSSVWTVYKGHSNNYAVITGGYLNIYDYNDSGTAVVTNNKMPYSMYIEARIRRNGGTSSSQMDAHFGYRSSPGAGRPNRGYSNIDVVQAANDRLHYLDAYDTGIQGFTSLSTTWYIWEAVWSPGYQKSIYRDEVLERASANSIFDTSNYFTFHIDNSSSNPNLNVDWIRMKTFPLNQTYTSAEQLFWELIHPKLHAVYTPNSNWSTADHVYEEFYGDPLLLNDIHVTEGTSSYNNDNTILLATDRAAHVIEERQGDEENANQKRYYIP